MKKHYISPVITVYTLYPNDGILATKSSIKVVTTASGGGTTEGTKITTEQDFLGRDNDLDKNYKEWDSGW